MTKPQPSRSLAEDVDAMRGLMAEISERLRANAFVSERLTPVPRVDYVTIRKAAELTGYTERAIEEKIRKGVWVEGRVWVHGPDGRRLVSLKGYAAWVELGRS